MYTSNQSSLSGSSVATMMVTKLLMLQVGTFNDVSQRPYVSHVDGGSLDRLLHATDQGRNLTPGALGAVGNEIMSLSSTTTGIARVANGLDTGRIAFMMEVEFPGIGGITQVEWLLGYTDHVGVANHNGRVSFDPNMRLYFNNVMTGRRVSSRAAYGTSNAVSMKNSYQLISDDYQPSIRNMQNMNHLMRPRDVLTNLSMRNAQSIMPDGDLMDLRPTHGAERVAASYRNNSIPGHYLSRVMDVWNTEMTKEDIDPSHLYSQMAGKISEPSITNMRSLGWMSTVSELRQGGSITWRELMMADDTRSIEDRAVVILAESTRTRGMLAMRGTTANWGGNGYETLITANMVQAVPSLMISYMLTQASFTASNRDPAMTGQWRVMLSEVQTFNDGDTSRQIQAWISEMEKSLLPGLSQNNEIDMDLEATFDVMGQTFIRVSIAGGPWEDYMAPSFCDGQFSAVRAPNENTLASLADGFNRIFTGLETDHTVPASTYDVTSYLQNRDSYDNSGAL